MTGAGYIMPLVAGYLLGSIPTGYLVARAKGIDILKIGSGNIGATNVFRVLGVPAGVFVLLVDAAKGWVAVLLAASIARKFGGAGNDLLIAEVIGGVAAVLGHNFTVWLRFKGGKGIATSAGVLLGMVPAALGVALIVFIAAVALSRYVSLGSILGAAVLPFAVWFFQYGRFLVGVTGFMAALAIWKHRSNIKRLLNGTENKVGKSASK